MSEGLQRELEMAREENLRWAEIHARDTRRWADEVAAHKATRARLGATGILADRSIRSCIAQGLLIIEPFQPANVQPSSYDLTLGGTEPLILKPGNFVLAHTAEWVELPPMIHGQVHGRSSIGRLGVLVHFTAGLIDPGFRGQITLECMAFNAEQVFKPGDRIAQISFHWLDQPAENPYNGRYQDQRGAVASRFRLDALAQANDPEIVPPGPIMRTWPGKFIDD